MSLEVGDIVLCTVDRIAGTVVFVKIDGEGEGSIILSEIAPGRIRNLRNYVVPKKQIVCKVLRVSGDRIDLSLRRVTLKEQKEIKEQYKQEKSYKNILKGILKDKYEEIIEKILKKEKVYDFLEESKKDSAELEKITGKKEAEKILKILNSQKQKKAIIKKEINLTSTKSNGLELIKNILKEIKESEIKYISAGKYSVKVESKDLKSADKKLKEIFNEIENKAKKQGVEFNIKEK
jgi:translation initiation factor 2 alpha subunit (eIF-2alpha)